MVVATDENNRSEEVLPEGIIGLEDGWRDEIKPKAIDVLETILNAGLLSDEMMTTTPVAVPAPFAPGAFMPIYSMCYNMCTQRSPYNWSEQLYQRHGTTIETYLTNTVCPALQATEGDVFLLTELNKRWVNHQVMNKWMTRFFMYLDRYFVKHHSLPTLSEAGLKAFKGLVYEMIKTDVTAALLSVMEREREGHVVDRPLLAHAIAVFVAMGEGTLLAYTTDFEGPFLAASAAYYTSQAQVWLDSDSTSAYLIKAESALRSEADRIAHYLNPATESKLSHVVETQLLAAHEEELLAKEHSGMIALLMQDKREDLGRMFRLFSRVPEGLPPMARLLQSHIEKRGEELIVERASALAAGTTNDVPSDPTFIKRLLALHDHFKLLVTTHFSSHALFQSALKQAFSTFVNKDVGKHSNAELICTFCDRLLKTGGEKVTEEALEAYLEKSVALFSYLQDKDVFAEIYRNQLSKRLLNQRSASDEAERAMIGKLKRRCGAQFTAKMEGMLHDLAMGVDHKSDFTTFCNHLTAASVPSTPSLLMPFEVLVLTTGHWPTHKLLDVTLPVAFASATSLFKRYYDSKTSHRRLLWVHSLGQVVMKATYHHKTYDLQLTTLQAIVLLMFNEDPTPSSSSSDASSVSPEATPPLALPLLTLTFTTIAEALHLDKEVVKRVLHSLACGASKVLTKSPVSKVVGVSDTFTINGNFSSPRRTLRIPMASLEPSHNPQHVTEDRIHSIEAAVVRIMKARKTLGHQQLVSEVLTQLSFFKPDLKIIKRRIEALIDREFLERDPDHPSSYKYLA